MLRRPSCMPGLTHNMQKARLQALAEVAEDGAERQAVQPFQLAVGGDVQPVVKNTTLLIIR